MSKSLTIELVNSKCKTDNLSLIKNLNFWGGNLVDVSLVNSMPNLEVLSLSVNKIDTLSCFKNLKKLQELYLRKNNITNIKDIHYLTNLPNLKVLWLSENPITLTPGYREIVLKNLPNLIKLDDKNVTPEEREAVLNANLDEPTPDEDRSEDEYIPQPSTKQAFLKNKQEEMRDQDEDMYYQKNEKNFKSTREAPQKVQPSVQQKLPEQRSLKHQIRSIQQNEEIREERPLHPVKSFQETPKNVSKYDNYQLDKRKDSESPVKPPSKVQNSEKIKREAVEKGAVNVKKPLNQVKARDIKNESIMTAIMVLINELNDFEIQIVKNECEKRLNEM